MKLGFSLEQKLDQRLLLSPEMKQSVDILEFSSEELEKMLQKEMLENPFITREDKENKIEIAQRLLDLDQPLKPCYYRAEDRPFETESNVTFKEKLWRELAYSKISDKAFAALHIMIDALDDSGYLHISIRQAAAESGVGLIGARTAFKALQAAGPAGLGGRCLKECLILQIKDHPERQNLHKIITMHLEDIASNNLMQISRQLSVPVERVQHFSDIIKSLSPRPAAPIFAADAHYIMPDVNIVDGRAEIAESASPRFHISPYYRRIFNTTKDKKTKEYLAERLQAARRIIRSVEQRKSAIQQVAEKILEHQTDYILGNGELKTLTQKTIARQLDLNESTVSRAINGKYLRCKHGALPFSHFFASGVEDFEGRSISSANVKRQIKKIIECEDSKKPVSDQFVADILKQRGIQISRRTVAKYRISLGIKGSRQRKRF